MQRVGRHTGTGVSVAALAALLSLLLLVPSARAADVVYGVVPQDGALPTQDDLKMMPDGGISSMRITLPWGLVEATEGTYDAASKTMTETMTSAGPNGE